MLRDGPAAPTISHENSLLELDHSNLRHFDTVRLSHMQIQLSQSNSKIILFSFTWLRKYMWQDLTFINFQHCKLFIFPKKGWHWIVFYISGSVCCESGIFQFFWTTSRSSECVQWRSDRGRSNAVVPPSLRPFGTHSLCTFHIGWSKSPRPSHNKFLHFPFLQSTCCEWAACPLATLVIVIV